VKAIPYIMIGASFVAAGYAIYLSDSAILAGVFAVIMLVVGVFFAIGLSDQSDKPKES
jgi:hypothetical protein